jgi:hypothetical protein
MGYVYLGTGISWVALNLYWAIRFREYRKFLAGAFFVSWGVQLYFWLTKVSVPLLGTSFIVTPEIDFYRSFIHLALFLLCLYFGFFSRRKGSSARTGCMEPGNSEVSELKLLHEANGALAAGRPDHPS